MSQSDALLFQPFGMYAMQVLVDFNVQDLANMAWAFAKADQLDTLLFMEVARVQAATKLTPKISSTHVDVR